MLPIEFLYVEAKVLDQRNEIRWGTASEYHNDYFEIERSSDLMNWEIVKQIEGYGTTQEEMHYLANVAERAH